MLLRVLSILSLALTLVSQAEAHPLPGIAPSLSSGFAHPFLGMDHLLAMSCIGLWFGALRPQHGGMGGLTLVLSVALGAMLATFPLGDAWLEPSLSTSLILLGILVAGRVSWVAGFGVTIATGLLHGYAHAHEMPESVDSLLYGVGFLLSTSGLLFMGGVLGRLLRQHARVLVGLGILISLEGAALLLSGQAA